MDTITLWGESIWWLDLVWNVALVLLGTLAPMAAVGVLGAGVIRSWRQVWAEWVRPALDQSTDPAIVFLAAKLGVKPDVLSKWLVERGDQIADVLPKEAQPLAEKSPDAA